MSPRLRALAPLLAVLTAVLLSGCGSDGTPAGPVAYGARTFDGDAAVSVESLRGNPALLTSWATWCSVCKTELPALERLFRETGPRGLQVVAVNVNAEGPSYAVRRMASQAGLTMPIWSDPENAFTGTFRGVGVPTTVLLDGEGRVLHTWQGPLDTQDPATLETIDQALSAGAS